MAKTTLAAIVVATLAACTPSPNPDPDSSTPVPDPTAVFNFGTPAPPSGLDPALSADGETFRISRQILEGLVSVDATTGKPAPLLATEWQASDDAKSYTFSLREGVKFQDGTTFDAKAVCSNFERWFNMPPALRTATGASSFGNVFKAYADQPVLSDFRGCTELSSDKIRIDLAEPFTGFLQALTMPSFAISSPKALAEGHADTLIDGPNGSHTTAYAKHPVGTGPFKFASGEGNKITLKTNPGYWGDRGQIGTINFIAYSHPVIRREALDKGEIDAYDNVTVDTMEALVKRGQQIVQRDPFSVMYLGINQGVAPLDNLQVRQAIEVAIDKNALIRRFYIDGTGQASQFVPPRLSGFNNAPQARGYDPNKARDLLKNAGYKGQSIPFYYPVNVTRAYLPAPEKIYAELARQLTAVGLVIKPVPVPWTEGYVQKVTTAGQHGLHLFGWNGSFADQDNFLSPLFGTRNAQFGFTDPSLFSEIARARTMPDGEDRAKLYTEINNKVAHDLPALPLAFPISALAMSDRVVSYPASPVLDEVFTKVKLKD